MKKPDFSLFAYIAILLLLTSACGDAQFEGPPGESAGDNSIRTIDSALTICQGPSDCLSDEACTQGGHCVNITGERDATEAIQADLDSLAGAVGMGTPYRLPPNSVLQLNDRNGDGSALRVDQKVIFDGQGSSLKVADGIIGIRVGQPSEWSLFRDMRINPQNSSGTNETIGIDVRAHGVRLDNILFWRLGTGVRAYTYVGDEFANINSQQWSRLVFRSVHHYAIDVRGGDANAGLMTGLEVIGSAGIHDRSFLGNTYIAPTLEGTHTRSIDFASNAGRNLVLGAYVEEGDPLPQSASMHDLHVGGNAVSRVQGPGDRIGNHAAYIRFRDPESGMQTRIPGSPNAAMSWRHPQEDEWWFLRYWDHSSLLRWGISYRNTGTSPLFWTGAEHPSGPAQLEFGDML